MEVWSGAEGLQLRLSGMGGSRFGTKQEPPVKATCTWSGLGAGSDLKPNLEKLKPKTPESGKLKTLRF